MEANNQQQQPVEGAQDASEPQLTVEQGRGEVAEEPQPIPGLQMGRMVYYVLAQPYSAGEAPVIRPAIVVQVFDRFVGTSNLQVITDGENDRKFTGGVRRFPGDTGDGFVWKTSVMYSEGHEPGTWHWPPRE